MCPIPSHTPPIIHPRIPNVIRKRGKLSGYNQSQPCVGCQLSQREKNIQPDRVYHSNAQPTELAGCLHIFSPFKYSSHIP
jgi:hypothetical protein